MIPLYTIDGNCITSFCGKTSLFYKLTPSDIEGVSYSSKIQIVETLEKNLNIEGGLNKFYWFNQNLYLNTFNDLKIDHCKYGEELDPIEVYCHGEIFKEVNFYENYYTLGNNYYRLLSAKVLPSSLNLLEVISWPDFILNIKKVDKTTAKQKINLKRKLHFSSLFKEIRDIESESAYNHAEDLLELITKDEKSLYHIELFFILSGETKDELDLNTDDFMSYFSSLDGELFVEERGLSHFYKELIPGVPSKFSRKIACPSDYISALIPFHRDFIHDDGVMLTARSDNNIMFDTFYKGSLNFNMLIAGPSGQGKSMLANKILSSELKRGTKSVVLDLGNSFYKTTKFYGGIQFSKKFNPMQFKSPRYLKEFILSVIDESLSKKDEGRLFVTIKEIIQNNQDLSFMELLEVLEKEFSGIKYYFSELEEFITDEVVQLNDFTYCDFSLFPNNVKAPLIIYLIEYFKHLEGKKILLFDECWHLLDKNARYIAECFRTFRKYHASAIAISQNLDDFYSTALGKVIIQNTYWKILFRQDLAKSEFITEHIAKLARSIKSVKGKYSEFLIVSENFLKPCRFISEHLEYELFTSNASDNNKQNAYFDKVKGIIDFKEAIINYTKLKYALHEVPYA